MAKLISFPQFDWWKLGFMLFKELYSFLVWSCPSSTMKLILNSWQSKIININQFCRQSNFQCGVFCCNYQKVLFEKTTYPFIVINRPGVAEAVNSVSQPFPSKLLTGPQITWPDQGLSLVNPPTVGSIPKLPGELNMAASSRPASRLPPRISKIYLLTTRISKIYLLTTRISKISSIPYIFSFRQEM